MLLNESLIRSIPFCILLIISSGSDASSISSPALVAYNSSCDNHTFCNPEGLLMCISGSCQCESPSNQRYDMATRTCVSVVGGQCSHNRDSSSTPQRKCIRNANCVLNLLSLSYNYTECQCQHGFLENSEGNCVPGIGQPCNYGPDECNPLGMVVCKNGKCNCLDELQVYDRDMKRCVSPAGTHCKYDGMQLGCVRNAICYPFYYWIPPRCICKPGYMQTRNRTCILEIDMLHRMESD